MQKESIAVIALFTRIYFHLDCLWLLPRWSIIWTVWKNPTSLLAFKGLSELNTVRRKIFLYWKSFVLNYSVLNESNWLLDFFLFWGFGPLGHNPLLRPEGPKQSSNKNLGALSISGPTWAAWALPPCTDSRTKESRDWLWGALIAKLTWELINLLNQHTR